MKRLFNKKTGLIVFVILIGFLALFLFFNNFIGFFVQIFSYSSPEIINASVEPIKVEPSDYMIITALVKDEYGIESVIADMAGIDIVNLTLVSGNLTYGIWQGSWFVHSVEVGKSYNATIIARNVKGKESYYIVQFHDDPIFAGRMEINVTGNMINRVVIDTKSLISRGLMRSDCGDIRFTDSKSFDSALWTRSFSYNINQTTCNTSSTIFSVEVPAGINKIYAYFGNPAVTSAANSSISTRWLYSWLYRKPITINNTQNSNTLTDYQVLVIVDTASLISAGKMRSDCGDMRFTYYNLTDGSEKEVPFYIYTNQTSYTGLSYSWGSFGCNSPTTMVRVRVPFIPANSYATIYMYYGSSGATFNNNIYNIYSDTSGIMSATLPSGRYGLSCAPYGDSIYCFGGYNGNHLNQIVKYNVTSNTVTTMSATLPSGRAYFSCSPYGDSIYCFGGYNDSLINEIVRYNVISNTVTRMSATLPSERYGLSCAPYGDSIYCFGGYDGSYLNQIVKYNVTSNTVTTMSATLPSGRYGLSCSPYGDSIYCFGGSDINGYINQIVRYNVTSNTVTTMSATLPTGRAYFSCSPYGDSIYCFGGYNGSSYLNQIVKYNVTSNTVTTMSATLPSGRHDLSCSPYGDSIYCFGGSDGSYLNQMVRYALKYTSPEPTYSIGAEEALKLGGPLETWIRISGGSGNLLISGGSENLKIK